MVRLPGPFLYVRLRRDDYAPAELDAWAARLEPFLSAGTDVYAFFKHDPGGRAAERGLGLGERPAGAPPREEGGAPAPPRTTRPEDAPRRARAGRGSRGSAASAAPAHRGRTRSGPSRSGGPRGGGRADPAAPRRRAPGAAGRDCRCRRSGYATAT